jgi:hypothetical protein
MSDPTYQRVRQYYARLRRSAYQLAREEAIQSGAVTVPLRLADCDKHALAVWRTTWLDPHPTGSGGWDWNALLRRAWQDPSALNLAIWSERALCGMAVGRVSRRSHEGRRAWVSIDFVEGAPAPDHPLRGAVASLAISSADHYGRGLGAERLRIAEPLSGTLEMYVQMGFIPVWASGRVLYCERRIES